MKQAQRSLAAILAVIGFFAFSHTAEAEKVFKADRGKATGTTTEEKEAPDVLSLATLTIKNLYEACKFEPEKHLEDQSMDDTEYVVLSANRKACDFYFGGIIHILFLTPEARTAINYCPPPDITFGEQINSFMVWAKKNLDTKGEQLAISGILESFSKAHPCEKESLRKKDKDR